MSNPPIRFLYLTALALAAFAVILVCPQRAQAANIVVNSLADNTTAGNSLCTLREAILTASNVGNGDCGANSNANDTITFNVPGTLRLASTLPSIVSGPGTITIDGGGTVTISGDTDNDGIGNVRVFVVNVGATLALQNITITKGRVAAGLFSLDSTGAGVFNAGTLNVTNSTFSGHSSEASGGAIYIHDGTVNVEGSTFTNNTSGGFAAAIINNRNLNINNSTFADNTSGFSGGAVAALNGHTTVKNSTFVRNVSNSNAGALYAYGNDFFNIYVTVDIINSTFHDNTSLDGGGRGAILAGSSTTRVNITNSTIVGNRVTFINQTSGSRRTRQ